MRGGQSKHTTRLLHARAEHVLPHGGHDLQPEHRLGELVDGRDVAEDGERENRLLQDGAARFLGQDHLDDPGRGPEAGQPAGGLGVRRRRAERGLVVALDHRDAGAWGMGLDLRWGVGLAGGRETREETSCWHSQEAEEGAREGGKKWAGVAPHQLDA